MMLGMHFLLPSIGLISQPWTLLGLIPLSLGFVINLSADRAFHQSETTVSPFGISTTLVTHGPYQFTRNPMYLGFILILFGVAVLLGSLLPLIIVPAYGYLMDKLFIRMEEQKLAATFDQEWVRYKNRTRRWL